MGEFFIFEIDHLTIPEWNFEFFPQVLHGGISSISSISSMSSISSISSAFQWKLTADHHHPIFRFWFCLVTRLG
jgi:hypothetical protein